MIIMIDKLDLIEGAKELYENINDVNYKIDYLTSLFKFYVPYVFIERIKEVSIYEDDDIPMLVITFIGDDCSKLLEFFNNEFNLSNIEAIRFNDTYEIRIFYKEFINNE